MPRRMPYRRFWLSAMGLPTLFLGIHSALADTRTPFTFHDVNVLGTSMDMKVTTPTDADAKKAHEIALAEIDRLRGILSTYDPKTDISKLNETTSPVHVSQELIDVLKLYETWQSKTKGAYSAGTGELVAIWKKAEKDGKPPEPAVIAEAVKKIQKPLWKIDDAAKTVQRLVDVPINIDSLGKGFIINQAAIVARQKVSSIRGILVNIGGDIIALGGCNTSGPFTPWTIGITDPALPAENAPAIVEIHVTAMTVATSGNYARGYTFGENKYSHILDPRTGYPVDFKDQEAVIVDSATVIAPDNTTANALATSLCVLKPEEGLALIRSTPEAQCLLIMSDGTEQRSSGFKRFEVAGTANAGSPKPPPNPSPNPRNRPAPPSPPPPNPPSPPVRFPKTTKSPSTSRSIPCPPATSPPARPSPTWPSGSKPTRASMSKRSPSGALPAIISRRCANGGSRSRATKTP